MSRRYFIRIALLVGSLQACAGRADVSPDAGPLTAPQTDAGSTDAGPSDAPADAGDGGSTPADAGDGGSTPADAGAADAGLDAGPGVFLALTLHRATAGTPTPILVWVTATDGTGQPVTGLDVVVETGSAAVPAAGDGGVYLATVTPPFTSGELPLRAHLVGSDGGVTVTALVLPSVAAWWDQPQPVSGLVNTAGTEDSSTISPDGQWLILGTYTPVDLLCCDLGCGGYPALDGRNPICSAALGPVSGPARPGMPGAERVLSSTDIDFADALMCAAEPDGGPVLMPGSDGGTYPFALAPVANYGFHRQSDGSFAEPFLINTGSDGFLSQPFCFTFLGSGAPGDSVPVVFGYNIDSPSDPKPHPWFTELTLGQTDSLGSYACNSPLPGYPTFTPGQITPLPVGPAGQQAGNTSVAGASSGYYLFSDDESASPPYVEYSLADGGGGYSEWAPVALPEPGVDRRQPVAVGGRLYYYRAAQIASVAWDGGDPGEAASFTDLATELAGETSPTGRVGEVIAVGQPTFAAVDGGAEMFFVYYRRSATGFDGQIGTVPLR